MAREPAKYEKTLLEKLKKESSKIEFFNIYELPSLYKLAASYATFTNTLCTCRSLLPKEEYEKQLNEIDRDTMLALTLALDYIQQFYSNRILESYVKDGLYTERMKRE